MPNDLRWNLFSQKNTFIHVCVFESLGCFCTNNPQNRKIPPTDTHTHTMSQTLWPFNRAATVVGTRRMASIAMRRTRALVPGLGLSFPPETLEATAAASALYHAVGMGYRHFDFTHRSELADSGGVLQEHFAKEGRRNTFVSFKAPYTENEAELVDAVQHALESLQCGYFDLVSAEWPTDISVAKPDIIPADFLNHWKAISTLRPPHNKLTRHVGAGNGPTEFLGNAVLRDCEHFPDGYHHEFSLAMQMGGLRSTLQSYDIPFFAHVVVPEEVEGKVLLQQAAAAKQTTLLGLTVKMVIANDAIAVAPAQDNVEWLAALLESGTLPTDTDTPLHLTIREREVIKTCELGLKARTIGSAYKSLWGFDTRQKLFR